MGLIASASKAIRLLGSRRYTSGDLTTAQEAFTSVLDLNASEIFTQQASIPSSGLPFSGSSQNRTSYTTGGKTVLKYWYRQPMTKSNVDRDVWFFLEPSGSTDGVTPQLINDNQKVNFVSNKYAISSLASAVAEDTTPGYNVVVYKSSAVTLASQTGSLDSGDKVTINDYQFDYKTGILQFDANKPGASDYIYVTAYQYVGQSLNTELGTNVQISGSLNLSGSLVVEGLWTLTDRDSAGTLDLGNAFN